MMMRERYEKKHSVSHDVVELFENVEFGETMLVVDIAVFPIKNAIEFGEQEENVTLITIGI